MNVKLVKQIGRFLIIGGLAFVIDYLLLYFLTEKLKIYYLLSSFISFSISVIFNYIMSTKWVFEVDNNIGSKTVFIVFIGLSVIGLLINQSIMYVGVDYINLNYLLVKIGATGVVMCFNFITRKLFLEKNKVNLI